MRRCSLIIVPCGSLSNASTHDHMRVFLYHAGPFLDAYGGRALLLVSFAASAVSYTLTALSTNLAVLYLSRQVQRICNAACPAITQCKGVYLLTVRCTSGTFRCC